MASRAELAFARAVDGLCMLDVSTADSVLQSDDRIDLLDLAIEEKCLALLQAEAREGVDMRVIGTVLKLITDTERVGDLACEIAMATKRIDAEMGSVEDVDVHRIASLARKMFHCSIEAYVKKDLALIAIVDELEVKVDELYRTSQLHIFELMRERTESVVPLTTLLFAISHIERIADHALNIADRVSYMITGQVRTHRFD